MRTNFVVSRLLTLAFVAAFIPFLTFAQASNSASSQAGIVPSRITQAIDEARLTVLKGNTHPLARTEFDRGAAMPGMTLHRMLLSLKRSPGQESALQQLLVDLQDKSSTNYHQWLTPEQFGRQFGPSDQDMQTVTSWLESRGFQVTNVTKGRTVIEFSGTVSQVNDAFHTQIHKYSVRGEEHWANSSDPRIPSALAQVVAGVATLHNFAKKTHLRTAGMIGHGSVQDGGKRNINFNDGSHGIGPADFAKIYNVPNSLNGGATSGDGVSIAVVGRSNIAATDVQNFRQLFGIATPFTTANNIVLNGPDPGNLGGGEEFEAVLDASWSGAAAPNATVKFVVSETTETTDGVDLSEVFIIDNNLAPVMTESFGLCEQFAGAAQAASEANVAEQAAAQGITFIASTGDAGASSCDDPNSETVATFPIGVQVPAALPFTVALGGTMFTQNDSAFFGANDDPSTKASALGYVPEDVWNESCLTKNTCAADVIANGGGPNILSDGGGVSTIFAKPVFQTGVTGIPAANFRTVPDVSLNSAVFHDPTALCVADQAPPANQCIQAGNTFFVLLVGGTSVAAPSFAGIMALVNQQQGRQGEAGFVFYKLAASETFSTCNASTGNGPTSATCVFNDVTSGNNAVPGQMNFGTANAVFQAGTGYDEATGLGSVNVANLLSKWNTAQPNQSKTTLVSLVAPASHGGTASFSITVAAKTGSGVPTGDVSLIASTGASGQTGGITLSKTTLTAGAAAGTTTALPSGNYNVTAHYEGDGTFLASDSAGVAVNISKENSAVQVQVNFINPDTGALTTGATSVQFGSNYLIRVNVQGASGSCTGNDPGSTGCPTGTVTLKDGANSLDGGTFTLNADGYTEDQTETLSCCVSHTLNASYGGDASFNANTGSSNIMVVQASTKTAVTANPSTTTPGQNVTFLVTITTESFGTAPTGTVTLFNGGTQIGTPAAVAGSQNSVTGFVQGTATVTAKISGLMPVNGPDTRNRPRFPIVLVALGMLLAMALVFRFSSANRRRYAYVGLTFAVFMLAGMAACGGGGGGGGGAHTVVVTAKYSGDTNYVTSSATANVMVQ